MNLQDSIAPPRAHSGLSKANKRNRWSVLSQPVHMRRDLVRERLGNSFNGTKLRKRKRKPSGFELQNSLQPALPPCNSPTNCAR